ASLTRVVQKCLAKDPNRRWQSAADLADELRWIADEIRADAGRSKSAHTNEKASAPARRRPWLIAAASLAGGVALAAATMWIAARLTPVVALQPVRFAIVPPPAQSLNMQGFDRDIVVSPDGTHI